ncbi:CAMK family protein kinase [Trichomonas vaginalis G3]|uniref:CAMK family protein kinase n=1 Tax=Trichomonas vaginalis (strain ATCC PRA-98 / G3) TaxID=412133 RepID=A2F692_TRIV3|nr:protein serine/threonine kinase protein [Trichomonas vaginalis G3]EAX99563.1 CAMK family protein kinase [Trichomonas vaginalis G3]KAI5490948.1 protein serine/threonine kinase protein [Trichomonas vaginalis G3]|eukprot:XP_001312493.1 CAMK family protein kinase [Trichomonas vaginalis G3]
MSEKLEPYKSRLTPGTYIMTKEMLNDDKREGFRALNTQYLFYMKSLMDEFHHIVPTTEPRLDGDNVLILMRLMPHTLQETLPGNPKESEKGSIEEQATTVLNLKEDKKRSIMSQLVDIVQYFVDNNFFCLDFKPDNLLLDDKFNVYITDFGLGIEVLDSYQKEFGFIIGQTVMATDVYKAPELINERVVSSKTDVYALGITFFQMLTGFNLKTDEGCQKLQCFLRNPESQSFSSLKPNERNMLLDCLAEDPKMRIRIDDLKKKYFDDHQ